MLPEALRSAPPRRDLAHTLAGLLLAALPAWAAAAGHAHEHGVARLDVAVDGRQVSIALETPLDNLLGFERAPRSAAEQRTAEAALARLRDAATLFRFDAAAACRSTAVAIESAALKLGAAAAAAGDHADLDASYEFTCERAPAQLEHGLFAAFPRLQRLDVQAATAARQSGLALKRPATRLPL
ncbi:MAG: DUF2796 domain-containing protein [Piscinibacter sp.]|nr:DUF2796 domain-containing protein [Piscinibacter sp.]